MKSSLWNLKFVKSEVGEFRSLLFFVFFCWSLLKIMNPKFTKYIYKFGKNLKSSRLRNTQLLGRRPSLDAKSLRLWMVCAQGVECSEALEILRPRSSFHPQNFKFGNTVASTFWKGKRTLDQIEKALTGLLPPTELPVKNSKSQNAVWRTAKAKMLCEEQQKPKFCVKNSKSQK